MPNRIEIYDTTLRDGTQAAGLSPTVGEKLRVARLLDRLGVDFIEGGWPGANPKDDEFFERSRDELDLETATLVAFGSTRRPGTEPEHDEQLRRLVDTGTEVVCIVGKSSLRHVTHALHASSDEGIAMVGDSIRYLRSHDRRVFFDAEHFFDGYRDEPAFSLAVLEAAADAGAERLVLCDTNGGSLPAQAEQVVAAVAERFAVPLGVHFHNDSGCAVANSLAAVAAGAFQVQGCVNGYGERTGNADLCTLIPNLTLKMGRSTLPEANIELLYPVAHEIAEVMNAPIDRRHPYVGSAAFAHKAGLHTSGLARLDGAYEHVAPALVGNSRKLLFSELMGRSTLLSAAAERGWDLDAETAQVVVDRVKDLEHAGYQFEAADGSFELLVRDTMGWQQQFFTVLSRTVALHDDGETEPTAVATLRIGLGGEELEVSQAGDGPVHALDQALRAALEPAYPELKGVHLTDYKVRDLDSADGTAARVRVLIQTSNGERDWGTVGIHHNVIEASWQAMRDGIIVGLLHAGVEPAS
ncbi:MAG: citramalate synthase [Acidimicrobiia bacterium]|nr:MAG: citramalate synthase [Acidimicrobiia bacterium]